MFRDVIPRFVGRYEIWHEHRRAERGRDGNPLTGVAAIALILSLIDIYRAIQSQHIEFRIIAGDIVLLSFLILYLQKSALAWLILPIAGATLLAELVWEFPLATHRYPLRVQIFAAIFETALGSGLIAYGFLIRRRYNAYLDRARRSASLQ
jgi:hypothetical protein